MCWYKETTNQDRNKDEAGQRIHCSCGRSQTAEHRVRAGSLEDTVNVAEDEQSGNRCDKADQKVRKQLVFAERRAKVKTVDADGHDNVVHEIHGYNKEHTRDAVGSKLHKAPVNDQEVHIHKIVDGKNHQDQAKTASRAAPMDLRSACPEIAMPVFRKEKPCFLP